MNVSSWIRNTARSTTREHRWYVGWILAAMALLSWLGVPGKRAAKAALRLAENHEAGRAGGTSDYVAYWIPKAALGGVVTAVLLLLAVRWIVRPLPAAGLPTESPAPPRRHAWLLAGFTALLMLHSGWANAPRLEFSLWGDEAATIRKTVVGQYERNAAGILEWEQPTWTETFFRYRDPNNHPLNSILSRLSHTAFARDLKNPEGFYFDERAARLPAFAAGLLGLAALAWLGWGLGRPWLGAGAALLLAIHPWYVRYGVETRGYGLLLLFVPLTLGCLIRAARTGRWRWWISYGLGQFLILWSYPGSMHLLLALNISALLLLSGPRGYSREWRRAQAGRWFTACTFGAVLSALMMAPLVQPLMYYLKSDRMQQHDAWGRWIQDATSWVITGLPWHPWDASNPLCWSWQQTGGPGWQILAIVLIAAVLALGAAGWWRQGGMFRALLPALLLHPPLFVVQSMASASFLYSWYLFPALVGLILLSAGILLHPLRAGVPVFILWGLFLITQTSPALSLLRGNPIEQMREGTKLTRRITLPSDPRIDEVITVETVMFSRAYDPAALPLPGDDPDLFQKYLREADAARKPLFLHLGSPQFADLTFPKVMALVRNENLFEAVATLPGMDAPYTRQVFRYRGATVPPTAP